MRQHGITIGHKSKVSFKTVSLFIVLVCVKLQSQSNVSQKLQLQVVEFRLALRSNPGYARKCLITRKKWGMFPSCVLYLRLSLYWLWSQKNVYLLSSLLVHLFRCDAQSCCCIVQSSVRCPRLKRYINVYLSTIITNGYVLFSSVINISGTFEF